MPDFSPNVIFSALRETETVSSGTYDNPTQCGPAIEDDKVRYIYKIKGIGTINGPIELRVYVGPALREIARIMLQPTTSGILVQFPEHTDYGSYILRVAPITSPLAVPSDENIVMFGTSVAEVVKDISYEYVDKRGG